MSATPLVDLALTTEWFLHSPGSAEGNTMVVVWEDDGYQVRQGQKTLAVMRETRRLGMANGPTIYRSVEKATWETLRWVIEWVDETHGAEGWEHSGDYHEPWRTGAWTVYYENGVWKAKREHQRKALRSGFLRADLARGWVERHLWASATRAARKEAKKSANGV